MNSFGNVNAAHVGTLALSRAIERGVTVVRMNNSPLCALRRPYVVIEPRDDVAPAAATALFARAVRALFAVAVDDFEVLYFPDQLNTRALIIAPELSIFGDEATRALEAVLAATLSVRSDRDVVTAEAGDARQNPLAQGELHWLEFRPDARAVVAVAGTCPTTTTYDMPNLTQCGMFWHDDRREWAYMVHHGALYRARLDDPAADAVELVPTEQPLVARPCDRLCCEPAPLHTTRQVTYAPVDALVCRSGAGLCPRSLLHAGVCAACGAYADHAWKSGDRSGAQPWCLACGETLQVTRVGTVYDRVETTRYEENADSIVHNIAQTYRIRNPEPVDHMRVPRGTEPPYFAGWETYATEQNGLDRLVDGRLHVLALWGPCGSGKTVLIHSLIRYYTGMNLRCLVMVPRLTLVKAFADDVREKDGATVFVYKQAEFTGEQVVISTPHSLHRCWARMQASGTDSRIDVIICDEQLLILRDTAGHLVDRANFLPAFATIIDRARLAVFADADCSYLYQIDLPLRVYIERRGVEHVRGTTMPRVHVLGNESADNVRRQNREVVIAKRADLIDHCVKCVADNTPVAWFFSSRTELDESQNALARLAPNARVMVVSGNRRLASNETMTQQVLRDRVQVLMYTTAMGVGVSLDFPHGGCYFTGGVMASVTGAGGVTADDLRQAVERVRNFQVCRLFLRTPPGDVLGFLERPRQTVSDMCNEIDGVMRHQGHLTHVEAIERLAFRGESLCARERTVDRRTAEGVMCIAAVAKDHAATLFGSDLIVARLIEVGYAVMRPPPPEERQVATSELADVRALARVAARDFTIAAASGELAHAFATTERVRLVADFGFEPREERGLGRIIVMCEKIRARNDSPLQTLHVMFALSNMMNNGDHAPPAWAERLKRIFRAVMMRKPYEKDAALAWGSRESMEVWRGIALWCTTQAAGMTATCLLEPVVQEIAHDWVGEESGALLMPVATLLQEARVRNVRSGVEYIERLTEAFADPTCASLRGAAKVKKNPAMTIQSMCRAWVGGFTPVIRTAGRRGPCWRVGISDGPGIDDPWAEQHGDREWALLIAVFNRWHLRKSRCELHCCRGVHLPLHEKFLGEVLAEEEECAGRTQTEIETTLGEPRKSDSEKVIRERKRARRTQERLSEP